MFLIQCLSNLYYYLPQIGMSVLEWAWLVTFALIVAVYLIHFARAVLPDFLQTILSYGNKRKNGSVFADVPKRWFTHFYVWAVTWDLLVLVHLVLVLLVRKPAGLPLVGHILNALTSLYITPPQSGTPMQCTQTEWEVLAGMSLLLLQASRRLYECLFVLDLSKQAKMHLLHYLVGYLFYTLAAPTMVLHLRQGDASNEIVSSPLGALAWHHVIGACLFLWGSYHQNKCHHILADLRKRPRQEGSGSGNYSVPYGDWFAYVSNPHYLAEVLLYVGVSCIMFSSLWTDWALPSFSFFILTISGKMTHSWYLETFASYKKLGRRVIVPYVY